MRYTYILIAIITTLSCKSQNIVPIYNGPINTPNGTYYKDIDNDFNPYIGEWKWEDDNNSLTIVFEKKVMIPDGNDFEDSLIGEYQYIENGTELINSLHLLQNPPNDLSNHNFWGGNITTLIKGYMPPCSECEANVRYILMYIVDINRPGLHAKACMVHFTDNGIEKIRMRIWNTFNENTTSDYTGPTEITIPEGVYTFIKQD